MDDDTTRFSLNGSQQVMMWGWMLLPTPRILIPMSDAQTYQTLQLSHDLPGKNATNQQQHHKSKVTLKIRPQNETAAAASNCKQQIFDGLE